MPSRRITGRPISGLKKDKIQDIFNFIFDIFDLDGKSILERTKKSFYYITPGMYGAKGDGLVDDTVSMQLCINKSEELNLPIKLIGKYRITSTLKIGYFLTMFGCNIARDSYKFNNANSIIISETPTLFESKNDNKEASIYMKDLFIMDKYYYNSTEIILFNGILNKKSYFSNVTTLGFTKVFHGTLERCSIIEKCNFEGIKQNFISYGKSAPTIVDCFIEKNYINGNPNMNCILFDLYVPSNSKILDNYIDFAKIAIDITQQGAGVNVSRNTIDFCYRGINGKINNMNIKDNNYVHITKNEIARFPNADDDMKNGDWWGIEVSKTGACNFNIIGNMNTKVDNFCKIDGYGYYNININSNNYDDSLINKVLYKNVISQMPHDGENINISQD